MAVLWVLRDPPRPAHPLSSQAVSCSSTKRSRAFSPVQAAQQPDLKEAARKAASLALAAIAAASIAGTPLPAAAVSGGGGSGNSLAFKDFTGQDLRKSKYTKGDLRGADFSGANLEVKGLGCQKPLHAVFLTKHVFGFFPACLLQQGGA